MSRRKTKEFGWYSGGGFEKDPFLKEEDKRYYRSELRKAGRRENEFARENPKWWQIGAGKEDKTDW